MADYYHILGITKTASEDEIKKAYRRLAQEHHPDRPTGNEKKFKEINEAYQVLSNKEKRAQYDRFGRVFTGGQPGGGFGGFSAGGGSASGGEGFDFGDINFGDFGDITDIFETFFTGMGGKRRKTYTRGSDLQFTQEITLEEAYRGVKKNVAFKAFEICATCSGIGYFEKEGTSTCSTCDSRGEIKEVRNSFFGSFQQVRACSKCRGSGQIPNKICTACKGGGRILGQKSFMVEILAGVADGQLIKVTGVGEVGERGAPAGDLYIQVRVLPHKVFRREHDDLVVTKRLNVADLLLYSSFKVTTISGEEIDVDLPAGFDLRQRLRVVGKGMPHFSSGRLPAGRQGKGDLFIEFDVRTPKKVSGKAKKILDDLRKELE